MSAEIHYFFEQGLCFQCTGCGHCCSGYPGFVYLSEHDVHELAAHLDLDLTVFLRRHTRIVRIRDERRLSLIEKAPVDCVFYTDRCTVYPARPYQCRSFPFWDTVLTSADEWERTGRTCPGIGTGQLHSAEKIWEWLTRRPPYDIRRFRILKQIYRAHRREF
jgi:hypothetical protein